MRIAVVMPVHDEARELEQALASVAAQARPADELVVVDDRSSNPETARILDRLERRPFVAATRVVRLGENVGLGAARMAGIAQVAADAVLPLDADDELLPRALLLLERALEGDPAAAFASGHVRYFGAVGGGATVPRFNPYLELDQNPQLPLALFRAAVFRERGLAYPPLRAFEDWALWLAIAQAGLHGAQVEEPVYRYRRKGAAGLLAWGEKNRPALEADLRARFAGLYSPEGRALLKKQHAPALEIVWAGGERDERLQAFLARQTLTDVSVTARTFDSARELLAAARGKVVLQLEPAQLDKLARARPSLLEQALRCLEGHGRAAAVALPLDEATLRARADQPRILPFDPARLASHPLDLVFVRTLRAAGLRAAHLPPVAPARMLVAPFARRSRALLFAEDFARLIDGPAPAELAERLLPPPPREALWQRAITLARPQWARARRLAGRVVGRERLDRALHPWALRAREWALSADAAEAALREGRSPLQLAPLLPPSVRAEKEWLDRVPTRWLPPGDAGRADRAGPRPERPRALLLFPWMVQGGVERALLDMAAALREAGWELYAATHNAAPHGWGHRLLRHATDWWLLGETTPAAQQEALVQIAQRLRPDVFFCVHSWLALESLAALRAALPELKALDYQHMDYQAPGGNFARVSCERHDGELDLRCVSTEFLAGRYAAYGVRPDKVRVIRAGCDEEAAFNPARVPRGPVRARLGVPDASPLIAFVARFVPEKDPLFVLRVFGALDEAARAAGAPPLHFALVGDGPLRFAAQERAAALGLGARAHFLPGDSEIAPVLRDADLLLLGSRVEGLPLVFFEALALETPVVTTAIEGIPELVDGEVGACVPDSADEAARREALVQAALALVLDPAKRRAAGEAGRRRVRARFSAAQTRRAWVQAFGSLLASQAQTLATET